jgi:outer membrane protein assembly factor BamB
MFVGTFDNRVLGVDLDKGEVAWSYENPDRQFPYLSSAAVSGNAVVVGGRDKALHALRADTGEPLWSYATQGKIDSSPVIAGERVFVGSASGEIVALDLKSGDVVWSFDSGAPIIASPSVAAGRLVIGNIDGQLYCFGQVQR